MKRKRLDEEIKKRVRALEQDIPAGLEERFLEKLDGKPDGLSPVKQRSRPLINSLSISPPLI